MEGLIATQLTEEGKKVPKAPSYYLGGALPIEKPIVRKILERAGIKTSSTNNINSIFVLPVG